ncbi:MAG: gliding motility-associated C-terminal domain-containing protein [Bacteroidota bacterium]|nr:gliding motility-associated C-terminal domain-containing protein [Bacteroidota bacterium]
MNIYNRYGQLVYHSTGYDKPRDGKINGKAAPSGTYYYIIRYNKQLSPFAGFVDIIY